jgi:acyl carrier protein
MSDLYQTLATIIGTELDCPPPALTPDSQLEDLPGWDSVALAGVLVGLETRFGVAIGRTEINAIETAGDLARLCQRAPG